LKGWVWNFFFGGGLAHGAGGRRTEPTGSPAGVGVRHVAWGRYLFMISSPGNLAAGGDCARRAHWLMILLRPLGLTPHQGGKSVTASGCLFCRIAAGEIPADVVRADPDVVAFRDINPQAPTHILIIPREHISSVSDLEEPQAQVMGKLFLAAKELAREEGIAEGGYRMVVNAGADAGQTVFHIHLHLLGGRGMGWPPG